VEAAQIESEKSRDRLKEENYIVDCDKAKQVCVNAGSAAVELFVGKYPTIKFDVNPETLVQAK
jgi:hypothetical protein